MEDRLALRISVTARCTLRCAYCSGGESRSGALGLEAILRFVRAAREVRPVGSIRLTGGEPLLRPDLVSLVGALSDEGIEDLALTTNAQALAARAGDLRRAGLRRVNVSLDSLRPSRYARMTGGGELVRTLAGIRAAREVGLDPVKVNCVVLGGENEDEIVPLARFAIEEGVHVRFLEVMPIAEPWRRSRLVSASWMRERLAGSFDLTPLARDPGRTSADYEVREADGSRGTVGLIASVTRPFCRGCRRLRLTSDGRLVNCLARGNGPPLRDLVNDDGPAARNELVRRIAIAVREKAPRREFETRLPMSSVGG